MLLHRKSYIYRRLFRLSKYIDRKLSLRHFQNDFTSCIGSLMMMRRRDYSSSSSKIDLAQFPAEYIRNFSIIAHVDHGKSTLSDRLMEITGTIPASEKNKQVLDKLQVERERGITVKAQTVTLRHFYKGREYLLNLIDTPGHVDFNYEVSRSLAAVQGVLLLVDANNGIQAQTVANFYLAFEKEKTILPVLNKIDLKGARPDIITQQLESVFNMEPHEILKVSAKVGTGVPELLDAIVERIPPPPSNPKAPLKIVTFDSWYDRFRGAIVNIAVLDGVIAKRDKITSFATQKNYEVQEIGIMHPEQIPKEKLYAGQVGYMIANIRDIKEARMGDTFHHLNQPVEPLEGFKPAKPMVFAGVFPADQSEYDNLRKALEKLTLNDSSVSVDMDSSPALGQGWRLGFLGLLHMDVFNQRLEQEHDVAAIMTAPNVLYKVKIIGAKNIKSYRSDIVSVVNPCQDEGSILSADDAQNIIAKYLGKKTLYDLPDPNIISEYFEPIVLGTIITPQDYLSEVINLCLECRGELKEQVNIDDNRIMITAVLPLNEILVDFFDNLKFVTSGYASFDYEDHGFVSSNLVKIVFNLNGHPVDELTMICFISKARQVAKKMCSKLKDTIPRQLYRITIQASVGGKILAREDITALKKDVLAKCYGGDITRKMKLLRQQAEGKKKMRKIGNINVPRDAFIKVLQK